LQVEEKTKLACQPEGFYGPLTDREVAVRDAAPRLEVPVEYWSCQDFSCNDIGAGSTLQDVREKIDQHYRVRLILDNLPITTYDLEENPESIRPGFEIGNAVDGKYYINNHLMFKILVHKTSGQYTRARENMADLEAAAVIEVGLNIPLAVQNFEHVRHSDWHQMFKGSSLIFCSSAYFVPHSIAGRCTKEEAAFGHPLIAQVNSDRGGCSSDAGHFCGNQGRAGHVHGGGL
jgi:hypothetical protein